MSSYLIKLLNPHGCDEQKAALALALATLEAGSRGLPEEICDGVMKVLVNTLAVVGTVL